MLARAPGGAAEGVCLQGLLGAPGWVLALCLKRCEAAWFLRPFLDCFQVRGPSGIEVGSQWEGLLPAGSRTGLVLCIDGPGGYKLTKRFILYTIDGFSPEWSVLGWGW